MCSNSIKWFLLVYSVLHSGETESTNEIYKFKQSLSDLIVQYRINNATNNGNTTDLCIRPLERNVSDFQNSELFDKFHLKDYYASDFKCKKLCFKVNYTIEEIEVIPVVVISNDVKLNTENNTVLELESKANNSLGVTEKDIADTTEHVENKDAGSTEKANNTGSTEKYVNKTENEGNETNTKDLNHMNNNKTGEEVTTEYSPQMNDTLSTYSQNVTNTDVDKETQENEDKGKKTAIIVGASVVSVATTAIASVFVYKWVITLLQSGVYTIPA